MDILMAVLLTILTIANATVIFVIAWAVKGYRDKSSRMGGIFILSVLAVDMLVVIGGMVL